CYLLDSNMEYSFILLFFSITSIIGDEAPDLIKLDKIDKKLTMHIPKEAQDFLRSLSDTEKEAIEWWAYEFTVTGDSAKGRQHVFNNSELTGLQRKMNAAEQLVKNLTDVETSEEGTYFVDQLMNTVAYIQAAVLSGYHVEPENLKALVLQFAYEYNHMKDETKRIIDGKITIFNDIYKIHYINNITKQWMNAARYKHAYPDFIAENVVEIAVEAEAEEAEFEDQDNVEEPI
ncbi:hypothetical protein PENTCL1PPCAC_10948, partial [Pristionchus entomophagus]